MSEKKSVKDISFKKSTLYFSKEDIVSLTILTDGSDLNNLDNVTLLGVKPIRQIKDVAAFVSELVIKYILFQLYEYKKGLM